MQRKNLTLIFILSLVVIVLIVFSASKDNRKGIAESLNTKTEGKKEEYSSPLRNIGKEPASEIGSQADIKSGTAYKYKRGQNDSTRPLSPVVMNIIASATDEKLEKYKKNSVHSEWMVEVESSIGDKITEGKKNAIREHHIMFLYANDEMENEYLRGRISHEDLKTQLVQLFKWNHEFYQQTLTDVEYKLLYNVRKGEADEIVSGTIGTFPELQIHNKSTTTEDVYKKVSKYKINQIIDLQKERLLKIKSIEEQSEAQKTSDEAAIQALNQEDQIYYKKAHQILTPEEFKLIFGKFGKNILQR